MPVIMEVRETLTPESLCRILVYRGAPCVICHHSELDGVLLLFMFLSLEIVPS